jgi:3-hydroxybutyryl-CoA dehydratase
MKSLRERAAEGLQVGDTFRTSRIFTHNDVIHFAQISRDYNPIHFDVRFAKARNLISPICHGLLVASLVTEIGGQIGWLASGMSFQFKAPVYPGEKITCNWEITAIDQKGRAKALVTITKDGGMTAIEAEIGGIVPGFEERKVLSRMLLEGDKTNGTTDTKFTR